MSKSKLAGRIPFPDTLVSFPLSDSSTNTVEPKLRRRTDSTDTIRISKPLNKAKTASTKNLKRARDEPDSVSHIHSDARARTRQRTTSILAKDKSRVDAPVDQILQRMLKKNDPPTFREVKQKLAVKPRPRLDLGRALPAATVLTVANIPDEYADIPTIPDEFSDGCSDAPSPLASPKSEGISRRNLPSIPAYWEGSSMFRVMPPGLKEYHDRFRSRKVSESQKPRSSTVIPAHLLPPPTQYEYEGYGETDDELPPLTDYWGNITRVSAHHVDMSIAFSQRQPYIEMWDMDDVDFVGVPARIHFSLKDSNTDTYQAIPPRPDFRCIDIECSSFDYNARPKLPRPAMPEYTVKYDGHVIQGNNPLSHTFGLRAGIIIKRKWGKIFPRRGSLDQDDKDMTDVEEEEGIHDRKGWYCKIWIPIPLSLFTRKESRVFRIQASAWVGDEKHGGILTAESDMVLSHLRSHREMD